MDLQPGELVPVATKKEAGRDDRKDLTRSTLRLLAYPGLPCQSTSTMCWGQEWDMLGNDLLLVIETRASLLFGVWPKDLMHPALTPAHARARLAAGKLAVSSLPDS